MGEGKDRHEMLYEGIQKSEVFTTVWVLFTCGEDVRSRTVRVVILNYCGGTQFDVNLWLSYAISFPTHNFLRGGICRSLTRFLFGVGSNLSFSSHVFAAAGLRI